MWPIDETTDPGADLADPEALALSAMQEARMLHLDAESVLAASEAGNLLAMLEAQARLGHRIASGLMVVAQILRILLRIPGMRWWLRRNARR